MASNASASIIYMQAPTPVISSATLNSSERMTFAIGGAGFVLQAFSGGGPNELEGAGPGEQVARTSEGGLKHLASGAAISSLPQWFQSASMQPGQFASGKTGFAGVRFAETEGGKFDYGWVRLEYFNSGGPGGNTIEAIDWAYNNTPGGAITAGEESAAPSAPEPSTAAMALLAAGWTGILALRRRSFRASQG